MAPRRSRERKRRHDQRRSGRIGPRRDTSSQDSTPGHRRFTGRLDVSKLITHHFKLDQIEEAYDLFSNQRDGVAKVAITP